jgi:hypothetical protein
MMSPIQSLSLPLVLSGLNILTWFQQKMEFSSFPFVWWSGKTIAHSTLSPRPAKSVLDGQ